MNQQFGDSNQDKSILITNRKWKRPSKPLDKRTDMLGPAQAHHATIESQGRGSLYLHNLIWLYDAEQLIFASRSQNNA